MRYTIEHPDIGNNNINANCLQLLDTPPSVDYTRVIITNANNLQLNYYMRKEALVSLTILFTVIFSAVKMQTALAITKAIPPVATAKTKVIASAKATPPKVYTDDYISSLASNVFNKLIEQTLPKDKLANIIKVSNFLKTDYDPAGPGLQPIYIPAATDGSATYFGATNLSASNITSDTSTVNSLTVNTGVSIPGTIEVFGKTSLSDATIRQLEVGSNDQPVGITVYDRTTRSPVCIFSENTTMQISAGVCTIN